MPKASMRNACREIGKKTESKKREQSFRAVFFRHRYVLSRPEKSDGLHAEMVARKGVGNKVTRVMSYRPMVSEWEIEGTALLYATRCPLFIESLDWPI